MRAVFDTCAVLSAFEIGQERLLYGGIIPYLVFYELGNVLWKNIYLFNKLTLEEAVRYWVKVFNFCKKYCDIVGQINVLEVMELAVKCGITFYDAIYVCTAKKFKVPLITADKKLLKKVKSVVIAYDIRDFI